MSFDTPHKAKSSHYYFQPHIGPIRTSEGYPKLVKSDALKQNLSCIIFPSHIIRILSKLPDVFFMMWGFPDSLETKGHGLPVRFTFEIGTEIRWR
jgi:hypothetical protein